MLDDPRKATFRKYNSLAKAIHALPMKDKRNMYHSMRQFDDLSPDTLFIRMGITAGEFGLWKEVLLAKKKPRGKKQQTVSSTE
jgi:hypothetical protein